jgi:hypothetical protein
MDKRISTLREVLFGIRVVKCYAWEEAMQRRISQMRKEEVIPGMVSAVFSPGSMGFPETPEFWPCCNLELEET